MNWVEILLGLALIFGTVFLASRSKNKQTKKLHDLNRKYSDRLDGPF